MQHLQASAVALRDAMVVHTREALPQEWVQSQGTLCLVLFDLGRRTEGAEGLKYLQDAEAATRYALQVNTKEAAPEKWASGQILIGLVLDIVAARTPAAERVKHLHDAITAKRAAQQVYTPKASLREWVVIQKTLADSYLKLDDLAGAAHAYLDVLQEAPDDREAYYYAGEMYHERLFDFAAAFALDQQWLVRHAADFSAQANFAEKHFTTGRVTECRQRLNKLLAVKGAPVRVRVALQTIEIASLLADGEKKQVPRKLTALLAEVERQPQDFKVSWTFNGLRHYVGRDEKLARYRAWLGRLLDAVESPDRDSMLQALRDAQAQFGK
jgi:hypothetical protein